MNKLKQIFVVNHILKKRVLRIFPPRSFDIWKGYRIIHEATHDRGVHQTTSWNCNVVQSTLGCECNFHFPVPVSFFRMSYNSLHAAYLDLVLNLCWVIWEHNAENSIEVGSVDSVKYELFCSCCSSRLRLETAMGSSRSGGSTPGHNKPWVLFQLALQDFFHNPQM